MLVNMTAVSVHRVSCHVGDVRESAAVTHTVMTEMLESRWALHTWGFCVVIHEVIHQADCSQHQLHFIRLMTAEGRWREFKGNVMSCTLRRPSVLHPPPSPQLSLCFSSFPSKCRISRFKFISLETSFVLNMPFIVLAFLFKWFSFDCKLCQKKKKKN